MKTNHHFFAIFSCIVLLLACKKDQAEIAEFNKNCSCAKEVSADFEIKELPFTNDARYSTVTDTILYNKNVVFSANETDADYTWYIGAEVLKEKTVTRYFDETLKNQTLPFALVVKKKPNSICLPNDYGYDSIVQYMTISNKNAIEFWTEPNHLFEGNFRFEDSLGNYPLDFVDIECQLHYSGEFGNFGERLKIKDLWAKDSVYFASGLMRANYREFWASSTPSFKRLRFKHNSNGIIELEFEAHSPDVSISNVPSYYFIGKKLN